MNSEIPAIDHVPSIMNSFLLAIRATYLNFAAFVTNQIQNIKRTMLLHVNNLSQVFHKI